MKTFRLRRVLVIAMIPFGIFGCNRKTPEEPYRVVLDSVKVEDATPREVYDGFDKRVVVAFRSLPERVSTPQNPRTLQYIAPGPSALQFSEPNARSLSDKDENLRVTSDGKVAVFALRLRDLPAENGSVTLNSQLRGTSYAQWGTGAMIAPTPAPLSVVVRKEGEVIKTPIVSKQQPFRLKSLKMETVEKANRTLGEDTRIHLVLEKLDSDIEDKKCVAYNARLEDEKGNNLSKGSELINFREVKHDSPANSATIEREFLFAKRFIPEYAGKVIFKTEVSYDDGWPLLVETVVRDK
jgi:hypothetical protein